MDYEEATAFLEEARRVIAEENDQDKAWAREFTRRQEAEARVEELEAQLEEMTRRQRGGVSQLTRIRTKCDLASGITPEMDRNEAGRAAGAEGAVDRLIALYAGAKGGGA
jgi:hypothetical protein